MPDKKRKLKIISWNVNGLRAVVKKDFSKIIQNLDPDILLLQETKLQEDQRTEEMINLQSYESIDVKQVVAFFSNSLIK